jgi:predicted small secreted protein
VVLFVISVSALTGCNTLRGVGKDTEAVGEGIQKSTK